MILIDGNPSDTLPVSDRGLQYGDGLFETIAVVDGRPRLWPAHMARLQDGCERLAIPVPDPGQLFDEALQLCAAGGRGVLKLMVTRGSGGRGYRPPQPANPRRILAFHPWPDYPAEWWEQGVHLRYCDTRLGRNRALAGIKHLNRLEQVLARAEWDDPAVTEGIMLDDQERVIEGTMSNLFAVQGGTLKTPPLDECGVAGVMRAHVITLAQRLGIPCAERSLTRDDLTAADELFLTNALLRILPVARLEDVSYSRAPLTRRLMQALVEEGEA
jgi:4-amino-4-deoxychorismate lyase